VQRREVDDGLGAVRLEERAERGGVADVLACEGERGVPGVPRDERLVPGRDVVHGQHRRPAR
jgi:hypothetical protein